MIHLENILSKFEKIVSPNLCNELAKRCNLIQRSSSRLKGHEFAKALMLPNGFLDAENLSNLTVRMRKFNKNCDLSASALSQRMNSKMASAFMKACLGKVIKELTKSDFDKVLGLENLHKFNRVLIEDSTQIDLHEKLSDDFKGGKGATKSTLKIDLVFDYLTEQIINIDFCSGNIPDQALAGRIISLLKKDDLIIRDLGYYVLDKFKEIEEKNAYYISRFKSDLLVYEFQKDNKALDLAKFLEKKMLNGIADVDVFLSAKKHPIRIVATLMTEEAINKRKRKANRNSQRTGRQLSKRKLNILKFCIFITNIPRSMLKSESIIACYRGRWRIELIFKEWKSCLKLHVFTGFNKERIECLLYGRLIMVILLGSINPLLMEYAISLGRELSSFKLINYIIADNALLDAFHNNSIDQFIKDLFKDLPRKLCMDKRKRLSLRENVGLNKTYLKDLKINDLEKQIA